MEASSRIDKTQSNLVHFCMEWLTICFIDFRNLVFIFTLEIYNVQQNYIFENKFYFKNDFFGVGAFLCHIPGKKWFHFVIYTSCIIFRILC